MNKERLLAIICEATGVVDKEDPKYEIVDCHYHLIGVMRDRAEKHKAELVELLKQYPQPDRLKLGPSYIEIAGTLEEHNETALRLMALGKVLGLWDVLTPASMGVTGDDAHRLAFHGAVTLDAVKV